MAQKTKAREHVTSNPTLRRLLDELAAESGKVLKLWEQLQREKRKELKGKMESELYVAMVACEAKLSSVLEEWDRVVDEELAD